jgi:hypothetical protein
MADVEALIDKRVIPARSGRPDIGSAAPPLGCLCAPRPGAPISPGRAHCACTGAACDRSDSFVVSIRREGITRSTRSSPASPLQKSAPGRVISTRRSCRTWRSEDAAAIPKFLPRIKDGDRIRSGGPRDAEARVGGEFYTQTGTPRIHGPRERTSAAAGRTGSIGQVPALRPYAHRSHPVQQAMPLIRQRRSALPTKFYLH